MRSLYLFLGDWQVCSTCVTACKNASNNGEARYTTTDQSTCVLVSPPPIKRTPTETAQRSPLSFLPESERSESVGSPGQESFAQYVTIGPPRIGYSSVAGCDWCKRTGAKAVYQTIPKK